MTTPPPSTAPSTDRLIPQSRAEQRLGQRPEQRIDPNIVQRIASDPKQSVWVTASAGAGKTKVLTDRVLRLLLTDNAPEDILCLTFTKAAASVMQNRIRHELSEWAIMPEADLKKRLEQLTGQPTAPETLTKARQIFALFLDQHHHVRIQTIHSFAQDLLRRFPIESGVPPYFDVIDEQTSLAILKEAQAHIFNTARDYPQSKLAQTLKIITAEVGEDEYLNILSEATNRRGQLKSIIKTHGGLEKTIAEVYRYTGHSYPAPEPKDMRLSLINELDEGALGEIIPLLEKGSDSDKDRAHLIKSFINNQDTRADLYDAYRSIFLTEDGRIRKTLATKKASESLTTLEAEAKRLVAIEDQIKNLNIARGTEALLRVSSAIADYYENEKRKSNQLDYDDLIYKAGKLMKEDTSASWLLQKLEGHIRHILIDEAQDTNSEQWELVSAIAEEFFNGRARIRKGKCSMFVVGDEKQSIYSFQQADPLLFAERRAYFEGLVKASGNLFEKVEMEVNFRSSPAIMSAVDAVFAYDLARQGLTPDPTQTIHHNAYRQGQAGKVEIHPIAKTEIEDESESWPLPTTPRSADNPSARMADQIAAKIKSWLDEGEQLEARGRAIIPSDILILVRRRSAFVDYMVRALKDQQIPVAGADRMSLHEQIAIEDLTALGQFLLFPKDDYALACFLKSPMIGMNDKELEKIALGRKDSLWEALSKAAAQPKSRSIYKETHAYLQNLMSKRARDGVYEFYSNILMNPCPGDDRSGLFAIYKRLGLEAEDALVEFMNAIERFEHNHTPTLQGFLAWLNAGESEIKRELIMDHHHPRVHIMTVHGAKGLEAPIVIMADTTGIPADNPQTRPSLLWPNKDRTIPLWVPRAELESKLFSDLRAEAENARDEEYRRLLYVAMTRAEDRLYVYGSEGSKGRKDECWYDLIRMGMIEGLSEHLEIIESENQNHDDANDLADPTSDIPDNVTLSYSVTQAVKPHDDGRRPQKLHNAAGIPEWAKTNPAEIDDKALPVLRPSQFLTDFNAKATKTVPSLLETDNVATYRGTEYGTALHALLDMLPNLKAEHQQNALNHYLEHHAPHLTPHNKDALRKTVTTLLNTPEFAPLFSAQSRGEVSVRGVIYHHQTPHLFKGQIDRLFITDDTVTLVDFKSNSKVPETLAETPAAYLVQMALYKAALAEIYPHHKIETALLWTKTNSLQYLPEPALHSVLKENGLSFSPLPDKAPKAATKIGRKSANKSLKNGK